MDKEKCWPTMSCFNAVSWGAAWTNGSRMMSRMRNLRNRLHLYLQNVLGIDVYLILANCEEHVHAVGKREIISIIDDVELVLMETEGGCLLICAGEDY